MLWSGIGKFGTLGLQLISNIVLARLLLPKDFGAIGMLNIFIAISGILVTAGFGSALIQKKEPSQVDYNSVFYWNLSASIILYIILFFSAQSISDFYSIPILTPILRVQSLSLIIQAFSTIQSNILQKDLQFKELSIRNVTSALAGTIIAIAMAYSGFGVWSLVANNLVSNIAGVILLWKMSPWRPTKDFSWDSLKELFPFGSLIAISSLVETIYTNIQGLIIGKWYSATDLGFYTQAMKLESVPTDSLSQIVNQVTFPVFSKLQDDKQQLLNGVRKNVKAITYLNFPLMVLLIIIAEPLITLLFGEKWLASVPYFQILCISGMVYTLNTLNTNVIKSLGKGKVYFFVQLSKRLVGIALILIGINYGIFGLLWSVSSVGYICLFINMGVNKRLINYGYIEQIKDVGGYYLLSLATGGATYLICKGIQLNSYLVMLIEILIYLAIYILASRLTNAEGYNTYKQILLNIRYLNSKINN